jgi:hypothetical protein
MSKPMGILKRKEVQEPKSDPPGPDTVVRLLAHLTENTGRTVRFISIVVATVIATGIAIGIIVLACRGIRPPIRYSLPAAVFTGGTAVTLSTIGISVRSVRKKRDGEEGRPPPK